MCFTGRVMHLCYALCACQNTLRRKVKKMEVLVIHKTIGLLPPEMMAAGVELGKKIVAKPGEVVPGGKLISSYMARGINMVVCLWDVPSVDALMPVLEQMKMSGWNTDMIPVEKTEVAISKLEKALQAMLAKH